MPNPTLRYFVGLDLGQAQEYTALAVLERPRVHERAPRELRRLLYALKHLHRFPLGTPYPEVMNEMEKILRTPALRGCNLVVDQTGVGRSVVDIFIDGLKHKVIARLVRFTITGGVEVAVGKGSGINVPKKELVGAVQALLQCRRLQVPRSLPDAALLVRELENFKMKPPTLRADSFEAWRGNAHDDLVLAVALALQAATTGLTATPFCLLAAASRAAWSMGNPTRSARSPHRPPNSPPQSITAWESTRTRKFTTSGTGRSCCQRAT